METLHGIVFRIAEDKYLTGLYNQNIYKLHGNYIIIFSYPDTKMMVMHKETESFIEIDRPTERYIGSLIRNTMKNLEPFNWNRSLYNSYIDFDYEKLGQPHYIKHALKTF